MSYKILIGATKKRDISDKSVLLNVLVGPAGLRSEDLCFPKSCVQYEAGGIVKASAEMIYIKEMQDLGGEKIYTRYSH